MTAFEVLAGYVTAPGSTMTPATPVIGGSLKVQSYSPGTKAYAVTFWDFNNTGGRTNWYGQNFHDAIIGIEFANVAANPRLLSPIKNLPNLMRNETLRIMKSGSAVGGDIELSFLLAYYEDVPNLNTHFITPADLERRGVNIFTQRQSIAPVAGAWSDNPIDNMATGSPYGINIFKADREYAIIGLDSSSSQGSVAIMGPCTSYLRYGFNGVVSVGVYEVSAPFVGIGKILNIPSVPVMKGLDAPVTLVTACQDVTTAFNLNVTFVELAPEGI